MPDDAPQDVEPQVDALIRAFDQWFQGTGNEPLVGAEKAIVKTFCWYLIHERGGGSLPVVSKDNKESHATPSD